MTSEHATNTRDIGHLFDYTKSGNKNGQAPAGNRCYSWPNH